MAGSEALGPTTATTSFFASISFDAAPASVPALGLDLGGAFGGGGGGGAPMPADP